MKFNKKCMPVKLVSLVCLGALLLSGCEGIGNAANAGASKISANPEKYVELGQYKGLDIKKAVHEVTDEEIADEMKMLASSLTTYEDLSEGVVKLDDVANIDYCGKLNGVAFEGGTAQGYDLTIGSHQFINGFEDGLVGVNVGETVDLPLTFPEQYGNAELAGQDVIFTVTVNSIKRPDVPEITDELIAEVSEGQFDNVASYKEALTNQIIAEYDEQYQLQYYEDLWNAAVSNATIIKDIPDELISENSSRILLNTQKYADSYQMQFNDFLEQYMGMSSDEFFAQASDYAQTASKENLVLWAIAKAEGISVSQEELDKACQDYVDLGAYASIEEAKASSDYKYMYDYVLLSKVQDFLAENAAK